MSLRALHCAATIERAVAKADRCPAFFTLPAASLRMPNARSVRAATQRPLLVRQIQNGASSSWTKPLTPQGPPIERLCRDCGNALATPVERRDGLVASARALDGHRACRESAWQCISCCGIRRHHVARQRAGSVRRRRETGRAYAGLVYAGPDCPAESFTCSASAEHKEAALSNAAPSPQMAFVRCQKL